MAKPLHWFSECLDFVAANAVVRDNLGTIWWGLLSHTRGCVCRYVQWYQEKEKMEHRYWSQFLLDTKSPYVFNLYQPIKAAFSFGLWFEFLNCGFEILIFRCQFVLTHNWRFEICPSHCSTCVFPLYYILHRMFLNCHWTWKFSEFVINFFKCSQLLVFTEPWKGDNHYSELKSACYAPQCTFKWKVAICCLIHRQMKEKDL